ncbi:MAG: sugar ABC transporter permease [Lachnospiraceae bacterium]|nr:sugar ABC transporter permease [Lachnospiraceae bacterium]
MFFLLFIPTANPARVCDLVNKNLSLLTSAISWTGLTSDVGRGFRAGWVSESSFRLIMAGSIVMLLGICVIAVGACMSFGNNKLKRSSFLFSLAGPFITVAGEALLVLSSSRIVEFARANGKLDRVYSGTLNGFLVGKSFVPYPSGRMILFAAIGALLLILTIITLIGTPAPEKGEKAQMESRYSLFLMFLPFALLTFIFCYLPLWGWRYSFFDYQSGQTLSKESFVGFKWFKFLFENEATRNDIFRVMKNTLAMSFLGIITSWVPLAFAVFLNEIPSKRFKRFVQTATTIPNFISWILVYAVAFAIFSTDGFINSVFGGNTNYLMSSSHMWLKMLLWGTWKGVGWSAIIYIAGIAGIDRQLYEAATVDGAGRFQRIWHVTIPGLVPTYMVMLLMAVAGMLSNGLDQYLVFSNHANATDMEVLDLYVYNLGIKGGSIPLSTVISMTKSLVSIALLFMANSISKLVRKESII